MFASKDTLLTRPSGYNIARSVRLRSSATAYFNRTPASAGNLRTWTYSAWIKRGKLGAYSNIFGSTGAASSDSTYMVINFDNTDFIGIAGYATQWRQTTQVFRDPSAWYHLVVKVDTTQAVAADRLRMYINGVEITSFSTYNNPAQNADWPVNRAAAHVIGSRVPAASDHYADYYLTEVNLIDGQALTPSSFGETNAITGVWQPKKYGGTYGTNGFYLNFSDNSNNTAATIGKDYSGNGNNWTPNNISVTSGVTYDSMVDSPTVGSLSSNYAVLNPLDVNGMTITNGNLLASSTGATWKSTRSSIAMSSGKWYCEVTVTAGNTPIDCSVGVGSSTLAIASYGEWTSANPSVTYSSGDGSKWLNGTNSAYGSSYTTNDVIGIAFDADALTVTFYKNNTSQGAITTSWSAGLTWLFEITLYGRGGGTTSAAFNFGQRPFSYTPPTGYVALNTYNLPASTITNGGLYMKPVLYTGDGTTNKSITGVGFQTDFNWTKSRSSASYSHQLSDSVRGFSKYLYSNATNAEGTDATNHIQSVNSDGYVINSGASFNASGVTYVAWNWKAGTTSASNTNGTITSTVSVGATQGFSVVTYTGTGANATVGHGLGVAPSMIILKSRVGATNWVVYHANLTSAAYVIQFNLTNTQSSSPTIFNSTAPTSSVFSIGTSSASNDTSMVAYCFSAVAGYSAFGSYTGNASTDGPFVYTGFRPRFVITKSSDATAGIGDWTIHDTSRLAYNTNDLRIFANASSAESTSEAMDMLSNGFKIRATNSNCNTSGGGYIYMAFAENPFKYALAR